MKLLAYWADLWMPMFITHMIELTIFISLIWLIDRLIALPTRMRCTLWSLVLIKAWVPPMFSNPVEQIAETTRPVMAMTVKYTASYTDMVTGAGTVFPTPALALAALWIGAIVFMVSLVLIHNLHLFQRLRGTGTQVDPSHLPIEIPSNLRIYSHQTIQSPVLVGLWKPRIYLPVDWPSWSSTQLYAVLSHEIAHYRHRDLWGLIFQTITVAAFSLHPFIWFVHHRLNQLRERRCDEAVIYGTGIRPVDYAHLLYTCIEKQSRRSMAFGSPLFRGARSITSRIRYILSIPAHFSSTARWQHVPLVFAGLLILPLSVQGIDQAGFRSPNPPSSGQLLYADGMEIDLLWNTDKKTVILQLSLPNGTKEVIPLSDPWDRTVILKIVHKKMVEQDRPFVKGVMHKKVDIAIKRLMAAQGTGAGNRRLKSDGMDGSARADVLKKKKIEAERSK